MYKSNFDYWLDHRLPDDLRQRVTRSTQWPAATRNRTDSRSSFLALDWLVRTWLPAWLDLGMSSPREGSELRELEPIADPEAAQRAGLLVHDGRRRAEAQWKHDEYRIWILAGDTATTVLREVAEDAAANTGAIAFMEIARNAAPNLARDAAYAGAYPAGSAGARAAGRLGRGADEDAIRAAATAELASTVRRLQESACVLYREMVGQP
jgi:hypothetical protein